MMKDYYDFISKKSQKTTLNGFKTLWMPVFLYDFQKYLVDWALLKGRSAIFADCGLGKTPMQLVWAQNIVMKTNKRVLILTPLAVGAQTEREAQKFGIDVFRSKDGKLSGKASIIITNYERLHYFNPEDFQGVICDESSAIKNMNGSNRCSVTEFMRTRPYRLLCTATASPNDYIELGTSSEALGELGNMDMLQMFFKTEDNTMHPGSRRDGPIWIGQKWRFKAHAEKKFWQWVVSWARAVRKPSDLGFSDAAFQLPKLIEREHIVASDTPRNGMLFNFPAETLAEQKKERKLTTNKRCELVAQLVDTTEPALMWCHYNDEADALEHMVKGSRQVNGSQEDDEKEEILNAFSSGQLQKLITKPRIGGFGLNWQHCNRMTFFPSHSFEQYYQGTRRCWRFGQKRTVFVDIISSSGESIVMKNLQRKAKAADNMFSSLVAEMTSELKLKCKTNFDKKLEVPQWI